MIGKRLKILRDALSEQNLDGCLIVNSDNLLYLSGFTGGEAYIVISSDKQYLITDSRYTEQAEIECPEYEVIEFKGDVLIEINELLSSMSIKKIGIEDNTITYADYLNYEEKLSVECLPLSRMVEKLRIIKDKSEIEIIRKAIEIADKAFEHILGVIKIGISEVELAAELEYFMKRSGASKESFDTIVASGFRSSMPHGIASDKRLQQSDVITMDFGAKYKGYCSDITRTVFLGEPDSKLLDIYNIVLNAQLEAIASIAEGKSGKEVDAVARGIIEHAGYGDYFGHGLGHGLGLMIHEEPRLSPRSSNILEKNMVVTVEPGIYIPGLGGVRIEDVVLVKENSAEILTKARKDLITIE